MEPKIVLSKNAYLALCLQVSTCSASLESARADEVYNEAKYLLRAIDDLKAARPARNSDLQTTTMRSALLRGYAAISRRLPCAA